MTPRPTKKHQTDLFTAIKETAWKQIAEYGAPVLSLRAIARSLHITAPAIYNYFSDRDTLVTALIVDAFTSLGEAQHASIQNIPIDDHAARLTALGLDYRGWALASPQRYQLIFGTPIAGYHAPEEITIPVATRALSALVATLQGIHQAGLLRMDRSASSTPELEEMLANWSQAVGGIALEVLYTSLIIWTRVHGFVSMEIGSQLPSFITNPGEVFSRELENIKIQYLVI